jgi:hypothetical protein
MTDNPPIDYGDDTPVEPDADTSSPYEGLEVQDGIGYHDQDATELDTLDPDQEW